MNDIVLLGDEALALGAIHAGLSCAFGYPGTPSTEIMEFLIENHEKNAGPVAQWCTNEKTAYESALGCSFAGKRTIITMKHVGLNVAADPFMNSSLVGIKGGLVLVVADDPSMHSSQGEQDSRFYSEFAMIPCFEPTTQQEAYEMIFDAFELSEKLHVPVLMRMVTRLAHSRAAITPLSANKWKNQNDLSKAERTEWMLLPALARKNYEKMIAKQKDMQNYVVNTKWNRLSINSNRDDMAIVTSGLARNYYMENFSDYEKLCNARYDMRGTPSTLHIGTLPLPHELLHKLTASVKNILVIEEGMPFIEKALRGVLPQNIQVIGKLSGHLPRTGELNPDIVRKALGLPINDSMQSFLISKNRNAATFLEKLPNRPPQLCKGCPHHDSYSALNKAVEGLVAKAGSDNVAVMADIGCYSLGATPPLNAIETIVCMGASLGMARGASQAGCKYTFGVIGDSTFLHSGITNLIDAISTKTSMTAIILDNSIVAMTGCQKTILPSSQLEPLILGLGVEKEHIKVLSTNPSQIDENAHIITEEAEYEGLSVIILVRECLEAFRLRNKSKKVAETIEK
ncbi:MAG: indolepyruvate ferredoxin oxidoreductase [Treponema sp.]|nr:indolepyruvate ferredoxin oxidoreductase [Treponema sp.]